MNSGSGDSAVEPSHGNEPGGASPQRAARKHVQPRPSATALLALYPAAWRRRYGDELDALIVDMHADGRDTGWRVRADLVRASTRERLRGARRDEPSRRIRGGSSLVLWAWALFVLAGAIVAKTSEHWQRALAGRPSSIANVANVAFGGLTAVAVTVALLVTAGIVVALPSATRFLRDGGWPRVRSRALIAATLTVVAATATVVLVVWAHRLNVLDRNGHDRLYTGAFLCWAALVAAALLAWTAVATGIARGMPCGRVALRAQARLAPIVAILMAAMTAATVGWWAIVGHDSPAALTGGPVAAHGSAFVPQLVVATALMLIATTIAVIGAARADAARRQLRPGAGPQLGREATGGQ
jgi:hypothetical protein